MSVDIVELKNSARLYKQNAAELKTELGKADRKIIRIKKILEKIHQDLPKKNYAEKILESIDKAMIILD